MADYLEKKAEKPVLRRCLECGDVILYGRPDKKFCCDRCKSAYYNRKAMDGRHIRERIRRHLDKNYAILDRLIKIGIDTMSLDSLSAMGYDNNYITSFRKNGKWIECSCYDITFNRTPTRIFRLMRVAVIFSHEKTDLPRLSGDGLKRQTERCQDPSQECLSQGSGTQR
jgi:TPR repeat protein